MRVGYDSFEFLPRFQQIQLGAKLFEAASPHSALRTVLQPRKQIYLLRCFYFRKVENVSSSDLHNTPSISKMFNNPEAQHGHSWRGRPFRNLFSRRSRSQIMPDTSTGQMAVSAPSQVITAFEYRPLSMASMNQEGFGVYSKSILSRNLDSSLCSSSPCPENNLTLTADPAGHNTLSMPFQSSNTERIQMSHQQGKVMTR